MSPLTVGMIGPTNIAKVSAAAGLDPARYHQAAHDTGALLAAKDHTMVVVPDRGVAVSAMDGYLAGDGPLLVGICPSSGHSEPAADPAISSHRDRCHHIVDDCSWFEQHHRIGLMSHALICVGLSSGTLTELAWTKWTPGPPVAIVAGTFSAIPTELHAEIPLTIVEFARLPDWLDSVPSQANPRSAR
jgi:predicted Rossmann-fold nucleotide-binding protein